MWLNGLRPVMLDDGQKGDYCHCGELRNYIVFERCYFRISFEEIIHLVYYKRYICAISCQFQHKAAMPAWSPPIRAVPICYRALRGSTAETRVPDAPWCDSLTLLTDYYQGKWLHREYQVWFITTCSFFLAQAKCLCSKKALSSFFLQPSVSFKLRQASLQCLWHSSGGEVTNASYCRVHVWLHQIWKRMRVRFVPML